MVDFTGVDGSMSLADVQKLPGNAPIGSEAFERMLNDLDAVGEYLPGQSVYEQSANRLDITVWATASRRGLDILDKILAEYGYYFTSTRLPRMKPDNRTDFLIREYSPMGKLPNRSVLD